MTDTPAGWEGILQPGEKIMWQGRPDPRLRFRAPEFAMFVVGAAFAGMAMLFIVAGIVVGEIMMVLFPMLHLAVGLGLMFGPTLWSAHVRRGTWYTLTDRRAIVATDYWPRGRDLQSFPIDRDQRVELRPGNPGSVLFAFHRKLGKNGLREVGTGFEMLHEAPEVYALIEAARRGTA
ncbi:MAG: aspartate carbamoyltransferase catalytic subunit [Gemmobacter sp.]